MYSSDCSKELLRWDNIYKESIDGKKELLRLINRFSKEKELNCVADAYRRLGIIFKNNGQLDSAITAYIISANIAESIHDTLRKASSYNQLGSIYYELSNSTKALIYFDKACEAYDLVHYFRGKADARLNMAEINLESEKMEVAERLCLLSMKDRRKLKDTSDMSYNYDLLSRIYIKKRDFSKAIHYSKTAIVLFSRTEDLSGWLPGLIQLGACFDSFGELDSAVNYFKKAYELSQRCQYKKWIKESTGSLAESYWKLNRPDSAFAYLKIYSAYNDTLLGDDITKAAIEAATRYDTQKKELELQSQKLISEHMSLQLFILILLVIALSISILLLFYNFHQRKKIQKKESELAEANAMIHGQDIERERIARELHDRVGSMLSTVKLHFSSMEEQMTSLVKQQSKSYHEVINLLDETYEEVRRISHDLDTGLLSRFGFKTATLQLVEVIESTNKIKVLYLDNNLDSELYKSFGADLYRITQELLNNTIKYASAKEISIQLSRNNGNLVYSYEDDGKGFEKEILEKSIGIGYKNIDSRVKKMHGKWHLDTRPGHGINLIVEIPLNVAH
jgi:signal transduction histidine kinase